MDTKIHFNYWNDSDKEKVAKSTKFSELAVVALSILNRIPGDIHMVSGPISTGGVGTLEGNRRVFEKTVETLVSEEHLNIFSQMPFEDKMVELYRKWHAYNPKEKYCMPILEDFYEPVFSSGKIKVLHFIHGWELSYGAKWEHDNCDGWGIERRYLPKELSLRALG